MVAGVLTTVVHGVLAAALGALVAGVPGGVVGAVAGLAIGVPFGWAVARCAAYDLTSVRGSILFAVDHTWSLPNTVLGAAYLSGNLLAGNHLEPDQSRHSGCLILRRGVLPGFATTIGTVQAGTTPGIRAHEDLHVRQARLFGPLYLPLVALHYVIATVVPYWLLYHDRVADPIDGVGAYFLRGVYRNVWHEWWAFRAGGPPRRRRQSGQASRR